MTVAFSPYEIACYAMGPQEFRLSYEQLAPHLNSHGRDLLGDREELRKKARAGQARVFCN